MSRYDDIINLDRPVSAKHPPMARIDRAAQFAPFQALSGFGATIIEEARLTDERPELDENEKERLDMRLAMLTETSSDPEVTLSVFVKDPKKSGGQIVEKTVRIKKIDETERVIIAGDGTRISMDDIMGIDSEFFDHTAGI
ncbi:MAG: YolD-like family protein [Eubacteriales bacterium]|nr:YolD-like family protein [Eubacteriales bacterium]